MAATQFLIFLFAVMLLVWFIYGPWQRAVEAHYREVMFEARDNIFMLAARGGMSFDDKGYRYLRFSLNRLIRFAHKVRLPLIISLMFALKRGWLVKPEPVTNILNSIPDSAVRRAAARELKKAQYAAAMLLIARSPSLWLIFLIFWVLKQIGVRTKISLGSTGRLIATESMLTENC